jgi:hypothetical protein
MAGPRTHLDQASTVYERSLGLALLQNDMVALVSGVSPCAIEYTPQLVVLLFPLSLSRLTCGFGRLTCRLFLLRLAVEHGY